LFIVTLNPAPTQAIDDPVLLLREHGESGDAIYRSTTDGDVMLLLGMESALAYCCLDGGHVIVGNQVLDPNDGTLSPRPTVAPLPHPLDEIEQATGTRYAPLSIRRVDDRLYAMTGDDHPYVDLYTLSSGNLQQLTDVQTLFPEAVAPLLSASADLVVWHPIENAFLYRARVRDSDGTDHNALYLYSFDTEQSDVMPYFGKDPVWSPDGTALAGSRLETDNEIPRYRIWIVDLESGERTPIDYGCNVQWYADWIAYDQHDDARYQNYVDCFANGEVAVYNITTGGTQQITTSIEGYVTLIGWSP